MEKFNTLTGIAASMPLVNIDTDMIIAKQFLKTIKRTGLGKFLFYEMRYNYDGVENPDFILNKAKNAKILVAGSNFGCGSSREHAPWALLDFGIRCIIAPSFADIFYNNCFKNGILPIILPQDIVDDLHKECGLDNNFTINLPDQKIISPSGRIVDFNVDEFRKKCLLEGLDDIGLTLAKEKYIAEYERKYGVAG